MSLNFCPNYFCPAILIYTDNITINFSWEIEKLDEKSVFVKVSSGLDWISKPFMIGTFIENDVKKSAAKMETNLHRVFD